jgi:hypothetical protein
VVTMNQTGLGYVLRRFCGDDEPNWFRIRSKEFLW